MDDRETAVTISAECGVETRQKLGVLWPSAIYKAHVGVDPKPDQLSKISIGGTLISGVLRDASHGCPTGGAGLRNTEGSRDQLVRLCQTYSHIQNTFILSNNRVLCNQCNH